MVRLPYILRHGIKGRVIKVSSNYVTTFTRWMELLLDRLPWQKSTENVLCTLKHNRMRVTQWRNDAVLELTPCWLSSGEPIQGFISSMSGIQVIFGWEQHVAVRVLCGLYPAVAFQGVGVVEILYPTLIGSVDVDGLGVLYGLFQEIVNNPKHNSL